MTTIRVVMIGAFLSLTACGGFMGGNPSAFQKIGKGTYAAEAERLEASEEFEVTKNKEASGGETLESTGDGDAKTNFEGDEGVYTMVVEMDGDDDGESKVEIRVNDEKVKEFRLGEEKNSKENDEPIEFDIGEEISQNEKEREMEFDIGERVSEDDVQLQDLDDKKMVVIDDLELKEGDEIRITVKKEEGEKVEMDRITLIEDKEVEREQLTDREPSRERRLREFLDSQDGEKEVNKEESNEESAKDDTEESEKETDFRD